MNDFKLAGQWEDHVHALAIIESGEDPEALGDGGRAYGVLQQHPAFFAENYGRVHTFPRSVKHTCVQAQIVAAASFLEIWTTISLDGAIQSYNLGVSAYMVHGERNADYLARWGEAYQAVRSGAHKCRLGG